MKSTGAHLRRRRYRHYPRVPKNLPLSTCAAGSLRCRRRRWTHWKRLKSIHACDRTINNLRFSSSCPEVYKPTNYFPHKIHTYNNINFGLFIIIILYYNTNCLLFHRAKVFIAHHTHHFLYRGKSRHTHLGGGTF